jgi:hypothetical protein
VAEELAKNIASNFAASSVRARLTHTSTSSKSTCWASGRRHWPWWMWLFVFITKALKKGRFI